MSFFPLARPIRTVLARLASTLLALAVLSPGQPIRSVTVHGEARGGVGTDSNRCVVDSCRPRPSCCDTSLWTVNPNSGASNNTSNGACNGAAGLGISDAEGFDFAAGNAFDTGLTLWI